MTSKLLSLQGSAESQPPPPVSAALLVWALLMFFSHLLPMLSLCKLVEVHHVLHDVVIWHICSHQHILLHHHTGVQLKGHRQGSDLDRHHLHRHEQEQCCLQEVLRRRSQLCSEPGTVTRPHQHQRTKAPHQSFRKPLPGCVLAPRF